jgi:release factor glutamine methyltransferase
VTVGEVLRRASGYLEERGVENPRLDAELLLGKALDRSRLDLYLEHDKPLNEAELAACRELVERRGKREPLAYVLGEWGFRRLTIYVDRRVLVPRPETEVVAGRALELLKGAERPRVLDLGTGSGAIALSIVEEHPGARVTGVDSSADALAVARENAERLGLAVELREGGFEVVEEGWDLVVSNPPYVSRHELDQLEPEVRSEPAEALVGDGLHGEIARRARTSWLVLEVGDGQAPDVAQELEKLGYEGIRITKDLTGTDRVVEGRWSR